MEKNKELEEIKEVQEEVNVENEKQEMVISGFGGLAKRGSTERKYYTTIDLNDTKTLYNIDKGEITNLINDCEGQSLRVVDVLIKEFWKKLPEPRVINEETGEVVEYEVKKVCILVDDRGEKYVTASKMFTNQMKDYIDTFGVDTIKSGLDIKIIKKKMQNSNNKALGFELI